MKKFDEFFLMDTETVKQYAVMVLHRFDASDELDAIEIGDGNINYVFKVWSKKDGRSVIIKQADKVLRSSGRPLDIYRNKIEASILQLENKLAPRYVPEVYYYDEIMAATSMEDVSAYGNLRKEIMSNHVYSHLAENISTFLVNSLLPTTDVVMDAQEKKKNVRFYINPELCFISEDLVFTEPYYYFWFERNKNIIFPGNEEFVREFLYEDEELHAEVAMLRNNFCNNAQALVHGDLHSGSIFANADGIKVLDPEFAFYGPMGYDIGNVIGNLFFSWANKHFDAEKTEETMNAINDLQDCIADIFDMTYQKLSDKYDELVTFPLYKTESFKIRYTDGIMNDSIGYAGTEIVRRVVGDAKVMEITSVTDPEKRIPMERALIKLGVHLIKNRESILNGGEIVSIFRMILS